MKRTGFTLVELLVVIAIMALLLVILLPGFSEARSLARLAKCAANLHHVGVAFEAAIGQPDEVGTISSRRYPYPRQWPGIPYNAEGTEGIYLCPEDTDPENPLVIPGLVYKSGMSPYMDIPFDPEASPWCAARRGEDEKGKYSEFVFEENTGHYSAHGIPCFGSTFWDERSWYPGGPNWSDNDGVFRFYDVDADGTRKITLYYYTCGMDNRLYYHGESIWYPLRNYVGKEMVLNAIPTTYGINRSVEEVNIAPDTIVVLDYPVSVAQYSETYADKLDVAENIDVAAERHRGVVNVLLADKSVKSMGATEAKPTMNSDPWSP